MKKTTSKSKGAHGCRKISSFFVRQDERVKLSNPVVKPNTSQVICTEVIDLDSPDEESESLLNFNSKPNRHKRKVQQDAGMSPPMKKSTKTVEEGCHKLSPQPSSSGATQSTKVDSMDVLQTISLTSLVNEQTPPKNRTILPAKNLFSPKYLRRLQSPEITTEHKELTPHKATTILTSAVDSRQDLTPDKKFSNGVINNSTSQRTGTPSKVRKTPKKLFERSPNNLNEFNVEVLKNFVKITPSKKEFSENEEQERQKKSLEKQIQNERTPVKDLIISSTTSNFSSASKVKTKLDFTSSNLLVDSVGTLCTKKKSPQHIDKGLRENFQNRSEKENYDINNLSFDFNEDSWNSEFVDQIEFNLDLTKSQHCKIIDVIDHSTEVNIIVKSTETKKQARCTVQGFWIHSKLSIGDTVHAMATKTDKNNWLINNESGYLVFEPDFLLSVTSVVNSVFCKRRTVFHERFRGFDPTNKFMIVGAMVHSLLQDVLRTKTYQYHDIEKCALEILNQRHFIRQIYESGDVLSVIAEEFLNYVPRIKTFIDMYVQSDVKTVNPKNYNKDDWKGTICDIEDIEENIWCPDLGVKGKVDVSIKTGLGVMPLEIKTGRASVSLEHRAQVLLYVLMMSKLGYRVSSGLLLYLKEGILKEVPSSAAEKRDIIILRNELAYYLSRKPKEVNTSEGIFLEPGEVPEPIDHPSCRKCPYNAVCMAYSKHTNEDVSSKKSLKQVHSDLSNFLTSAHIDYFMHWTSLLEIEMAEKSSCKNLRDIYTLPPEKRKNKGRCLMDLVVKNITEELNSTFLHIFEQAPQNPDQNCNFLSSGFAENAYVVISVKSRPAVATGFIMDLSMKSVVVSLDRNLNVKYKDEIFFLDSYESATFLTYNMSSLALILNTTDRSNRLRNIIVDRQPATFQPKLPKALAEKAKPILKRLNKVQQRAVLKAIAANEYLLIKGMPGTGKTATIVALIQLLTEMNKTVIVTSQTHSAVDTVCLKLIKFGVKFMRLGSEAKMNPNIREFSEQNFVRSCSSPEALEAVYNGVQVLAVTCLGSGNSVLSKRTMDVCIVDESTQVLQCSLFRPLHAAEKFILIGDPDQLPAVVRNKTAWELGMSESLFERLDSEESRISLNLNYRMNEPITALANALTYNGELEIGTERIAKASLHIPKINDLIKAYKNQAWLLKVLDTNLAHSVRFIDTGPVWNLNKNVTWARIESYEEEFFSQENKNCINVFEAAIIYHMVHALVIEGGVSPDHIGVIATYRVQADLLTQLLRSTEVDVNTVDQFQGKDKNIIIYSCSKSNDLSKQWIESKFDLTGDKRRLNVAITRAKRKLIIVGDLATLEKYATFKKIIKSLKKNVIKLKDDGGFIWDNILDIHL